MRVFNTLHLVQLAGFLLLLVSAILAAVLLSSTIKINVTAFWLCYMILSLSTIGLGTIASVLFYFSHRMVRSQLSTRHNTAVIAASVIQICVAGLATLMLALWSERYGPTLDTGDAEAVRTYVSAFGILLWTLPVTVYAQIQASVAHARPERASVAAFFDRATGVVGLTEEQLKRVINTTATNGSSSSICGCA